MSKEFNFELEEVLGTLSESDKHDWAKSVTRISWNENPTTLDIRRFNFSTNKVGKGISLTDEETDKLVEILLDAGYGDLDMLREKCSHRESRFRPKKKFIIKVGDEDGEVL